VNLEKVLLSEFLQKGGRGDFTFGVFQKLFPILKRINLFEEREGDSVRVPQKGGSDRKLCEDIGVEFGVGKVPCQERNFEGGVQKTRRIPLESDFVDPIFDKFSQGTGGRGFKRPLKPDFFEKTSKSLVVVTPQILVWDVGRGKDDRGEGFEGFKRGKFRMRNSVEFFVGPNNN